MKILLILILQITISLSLVGQITNGEIVYEIKENMHRDLPPEAEMYKNKIPEFRTQKYKLVFTKKESLYTRVVEEEQDKPNHKDGRGMRRGFQKRGNQMDQKLYVDMANDIVIEAQSLLGKKFIIEGEKQKMKWRIAADQKQVGEFLCQKATYQDSTQVIEVWFTPMIPIPSGPAEYRNLPGMILHVDVNNAQKTFTAVDIIQRAIEEDELIKPSEGKEIEKKDFEILKEEKRKEMRVKRIGRRGPGRR